MIICPILGTRSKMKKKLSIIIVTYKSEDIIFDCLDSIFKFNDIGDCLETIIVDNSSDSNGMFKSIKSSYSEDIKLIKNTRNDGYGKGNNIGAAASKSPYLLFFNPDARLIFPIFKFVIHLFENNKNVSMVGPKEVDEYLKNATSFYYRMEYQNILRTLLLQKIFNRMDFFNQSQMYINGACFFVRKESFLKAGSFDEKIFLYSEEPDLITRIEKTTKDSKCLYIPQLRVIHLKKKNFSSFEMLKIAVDSAVYYLKKHNLQLEVYLKRRHVYSKLKFYHLSITGKKDEALVYKRILLYIKSVKKLHHCSNEKPFYEN